MSRHQGKPSGMNLGAPPAMAPVEGDPVGDAMGRLGGATGMTQTRLDYQTAVHVQVQRKIEAVVEAVLKEAAEMGEDFLYAWEVNDKSSATGKARIEGISIDGAMVMMRNWGNCHCPTELVDETPTHFMIKATFIDLEKGFSVPRLFRQRKNQALGKMDRDRSEDIAFQIGQSKCQRNAIEKGLPGWIQSRALDTAKSAAERRYSDVPKAVADARAYAARLGITDDELERKVGSKFADWLPRDLVYLRSVFRAISDKQATITSEFRADVPEPEQPAAEPTPPPVPVVEEVGLGFPTVEPEQTATAPTEPVKAAESAPAPTPPAASSEPVTPPPAPSAPAEPPADPFAPPAKKK